MPRMTVDERVAKIKLKEAERLDAKVRDLRAKAIELSAEADRLRAEAGVKP